MANQTTFQIIAKALGFGKTNSKVKKLTGSMKKFAVGLVSVAAAYKAFGVGMESVKLAGRLEGVEKGFNNLRKQAGFSANAFNKFDDALNGTVSRLDLMTQANNAMLLGIADSEEQMSEMFDTAQRLAEALGQDATFGIESLVTGLGRQSKLMLDNLGIIVKMEDANKNYAEELGTTADKLTEAERKQAFINEAMRQGKDLVDALGIETETTSMKINQFSADIENFKLKLGEALIDSGVMDNLGKLMDFVEEWIDKKAEDKKSDSDRAGILSSMAEEYDLVSKAIAESNSVISEHQENIETLNKAQAEGFVPTISGFQAMKDVWVEQIKLRLNETELREHYQSIIDHEMSMLDIYIAQQGQIQGLSDKEIEDLQEKIRLKKEKTAVDKSEAEAAKKLNELKKEALSLGMKQGQMNQTLAESATSAARKIIRTEIQKTIAKYTSQITPHFAWAGPFAPAAIFAASSVFATGVEQMLQKISFEQGGLIGGRPHSQGGTPIIAEQGEYIMSRDAVENIGVDNLDAMNQGGGGGSSIVINNPIISSEFVESELPELIAEAVRKGADFGMS